MDNKNSIVHSLGHAVLVVLYVSFVAWLMFNGQKFFGNAHNFWIPLAMLLLFVVSATIVATLVLGRPALMYFNGEKREALNFFLYTLGWLVIFTVLVFGTLITRK